MEKPKKKFKKKKEEKHISDNSSDSENEKPKEILPKDSYVCPQCSMTPKFLSIEEGNVKLKCQTHGVLTIPIQKYLTDMSANSYINFLCDICKKNYQKGFLGNKDKIFKYCFDCKQKICWQCLEQHKSLEHKNICPVNKLNEKCEKHNGEDYIFYCHDCHKNICIKCNSEDEHKTHKRELLGDIEPSREEIKTLKKDPPSYVKSAAQNYVSSTEKKFIAQEEAARQAAQQKAQAAKQAKNLQVKTNNKKPVAK